MAITIAETTITNIRIPTNVPIPDDVTAAIPERATSIWGIAKSNKAIPRRRPRIPRACIHHILWPNHTIVQDVVESTLLCFVIVRAYSIAEMPDLIETPAHRRKQQQEGIVPRKLFMPQAKQAGFSIQWGSIEATAQMFRLGVELLGTSHLRLYKILGGDMTNSYHLGRRNRLSQYMMQRLAFLFVLKGFYHVNTGGIYDIDWDKGIVYFNNEEPVYLETKSLPKQEEVPV